MLDFTESETPDPLPKKVRPPNFVNVSVKFCQVRVMLRLGRQAGVAGCWVLPASRLGINAAGPKVCNVLRRVDAQVTTNHCSEHWLPVTPLLPRLDRHTFRQRFWTLCNVSRRKESGPMHCTCHLHQYFIAATESGPASRIRGCPICVKCAS